MTQQQRFRPAINVGLIAALAIAGIVLVVLFVFGRNFFYLISQVAADEVGVQFESGRITGVVGPGVYSDFGLPFSAKLSTMPDEHMGDEATWRHAEAQLKAALERAGMRYTINEKDGAFYGPKIDFDVTDAIGRKWQCATIQLDYMQPENFDLKYTGADNAEHRPVVIHRAIFGSFERFIAILIEHYAGAFPLWLAPVQAIVLPIADRHVAYAHTVSHRLMEAGFRMQVDERQEKIGYKIREAQLQKIPYMLVVGDREAAEGAVAVRSRTGGDRGSQSLDVFITSARVEVDNKGSQLSALSSQQLEARQN